MAKYATVQDIRFCDDDVVNPDDYDVGTAGKLFIFHERGNCRSIGVVIAEYPTFHLQDALDMMADEDKFDNYLIHIEDHNDYGVNTDEPTCSFLGNASEPFDMKNIECVEAECPMFSLVALFSESNGEENVAKGMV